jgi:hypothetical protein
VQVSLAQLGNGGMLSQIVTCDATIYLLLFGVKKRKKEQADVKKEQAECELW